MERGQGEGSGEGLGGREWRGARGKGVEKGINHR